VGKFHPARASKNVHPAALETALAAVRLAGRYNRTVLQGEWAL
jgi:hypothetical protein